MASTFKGVARLRVAVASLLLLASAMPMPAAADQGGVSVWLPGFFGSLAAVPPTPGWSVTNVYYHTSTDAGRNLQFARGGALVAGLTAEADLNFVIPSYTFKTPILWGGLATIFVLPGYGHLEATADAVLTGPWGARSR
jgi:hypothetical protein